MYSRVVAISLAIPALVAACGNSTPAGPGVEAVYSIDIVNAGSDTIPIGVQAQLTAVGRAASGKPLADVKVNWETSAPGIAVVAPDGRVTALAAGQAMITARAPNGVIGGRVVHVPAPAPATWDLDALGAPRLVTADYINSFRIRRVSYFRSGFGHDYSDEAESCRSMKHYFIPADMATAGEIEIFAPFAGTISRVTDERTYGTQVQIRSAMYPAITAIIFHVKPNQLVEVGRSVAAGELLGRHFGPETASDITLHVNTRGGSRLVSYFEALTDSVWTHRYLVRGVAARTDMIHTRAARNAKPLTCDAAGMFVAPDLLPQFVDLAPVP